MGSAALLAVAATLLAVKWGHRYRIGRPPVLLPRSGPAWAAALLVAASVLAAGGASDALVAAIVPAIALGGIAGALMNLRRT